MGVSNQHQVCGKGYFIAIISTIVETAKPTKELKVALKLIGTPLESFCTVKSD